jgi:TonB family protein
MNRHTRRGIVVVVAAVLVSGLAVRAAEPNTLAAARDLYSAAAYEDALALLERLKASAGQADETRLIEQYRAFCLLALGRVDQAERVIEGIVLADPSFQPSANEVSPSVRNAFRDARRRMLPAIIQQKYTNAKAAFDGEAFALAADLFREVLAMIADPVSAANQASLSDLRTLATGFLDLSERAATPALPASASVPLTTAVPVTPAANAPPRIYGPEDTDVVPPITVRQSLPPFPNNLMGQAGSLEVLIDENGEVEEATMRASLNSAYDRLALAAAREWRYKPAMKDGIPVKFRKTVQVVVRR